jgi:hypothetical protein
MRNFVCLPITGIKNHDTYKMQRELHLRFSVEIHHVFQSFQ